MEKEEALKLLDKYLGGECSPEECMIIEQAYDELGKVDVQEPSLSEYEYSKVTVLNRLLTTHPGIMVPTFKLWPRIAAAVAALTILSLGIWFYDISRSDTLQEHSLENTLSTVKPGRRGATVTLANGQSIQLSSRQRGLVIGDKHLAYEDGTSLGVESETELRNTSISAITAKGQSYEFTLPDGSKVWLNADSKITFDRAFVKKTRQLTLEGEAYFEVAKNKNVPFIVNSEAQQVEVLGTHFNVNTYRDTELKQTTLLEGAIRINGVLLAPNEVALQRQGKVLIRKIVAKDAIDWTRGEFICENESLDNLMKRISRWYDVRIVFDNESLKKQTFSGSMSRYDSISSLLRGLKYAGINSRLEGNTIRIIQ